MKKGLILLFLISASVLLHAKNDYNYIKLFNGNLRSSSLITVKYVSKNVKSQDISYTIKLPLSETTLAFLSGSKSKSRFANSRIQYSPRTLNLNNQEIKYIIDRNRLYNNTKENFKIKAF